jgi:apoptosis-inducing factor 3
MRREKWVIPAFPTYHGSLASGLIVDDTIRCPLHHACFSLRTGVALRAPALDPIAYWRVERVGTRLVAREKLAAAPAQAIPPPSSVVIIGRPGWRRRICFAARDT